MVFASAARPLSLPLGDPLTQGGQMSIPPPSNPFVDLGRWRNRPVTVTVRARWLSAPQTSSASYLTPKLR